MISLNKMIISKKMYSISLWTNKWKERLKTERQKSIEYEFLAFAKLSCLCQHLAFVSPI